LKSLPNKSNRRRIALNLKELENEFDQRETTIIEDWMDLVRFPSIGTDPVHRQDCASCAEWIAGRLRRHGFRCELVPTGSLPFVFAERAGKPGKPTVLFYGHYDVQPADPLDAWTSPPFEPQWRNGRLYARGAQDNKGQLFYALAAIETLIAADALDVGLKILIEGEEECGSGGLNGAMDAWSGRLKADILMVDDVLTVPSGAPTIVMGLRGIAHLSAELHGAGHDLHSGIHGGLAPNAAQGIARIAASLFDDDGRVAVPGFYDGVVPASRREAELAGAIPFDPEAYRLQTGATPDGGIRGVPPVERVGFLPSLDINGIHSGYGGSGMKTIIPAAAVLKLTARLAPGQTPQAVLDAVAAHLERHTPAGMRLVITDRGIGGPGFRLDPDSDAVMKAQAVLAAVCPSKPVAFLWEGASIPIVARLAEVSGASPLLAGFGHETDRIHAPDESFSLAQFKSGFLYAALFLQQF